MKSKRLLIVGILLVLSFASRAFADENVQWELKAYVASDITFYQDMLLFGDALGEFYAVNKASGSIIWTYKDDGPIMKTAAVSDDKVLYVTSTGNITCLNLNDGSLIWKYKSDENLGEVINDGVTLGNGLAFVAKDDAKLYALDINTGQTVWTFQGDSQGLRTAPAYSEGLVFLGENNGRFHIIDANTGDRINGGGSGGSVNTPIVKDGNVYFSSWDGSVNAVQINSVIPLWHVNIKDTIMTSPVIAEGIIALGTSRGCVTTLNENDGSLMWSFNCENGSITAKPVIADGKIYATPEGGKVYEIEASSGKLLNTIETNGMTLNLAYSDGVLYICHGDSLTALTR